MVGEIATGTIILNNETFIIPKGARTIDLLNSGAGDATFKGNRSIGNKSPVPVTLAKGVAYSFGDLGKPYNEIEIDATGTIVEVTANY